MTQMSLSHLCYLQNRKTDIENRSVVAKGEGGWERDGLGVCD